MFSLSVDAIRMWLLFFNAVECIAMLWAAFFVVNFFQTQLEATMACKRALEEIRDQLQQSNDARAKDSAA